MNLDARYTALAARDPRFDGVFYVGVRTTGIFCRPICPARTPRPSSCEFFESADAAAAAGFRACFRCRPERAPRDVGATSLARRAARRIHEGALNGMSVTELAAELGVSDRQLRRALQDELGASPVALAQHRRLMLAKHLLQDSGLDIAAIAEASGFGSVRRLNACFRERFDCAPSDVRRGRAPSGGLVVRLDTRPPYDGARLLAFLGARAVPGVERVGSGRYERVVAVAGRVGAVRVSLEGPVTLRVELDSSLGAVLLPVLTKVRALFDLDCHPAAIAALLGADPLLAPLVAARPGLRVPGAFDPFEAGIRALLGQQVSVAAATTLAGRFAAAFGAPSGLADAGLSRRFPTAAEVASLAPETVAAIGLPSTRGAAIVAFAQAVADGRLRFQGDLEPFVASATSLKGIGDWTAHYLALRALHHPDAFPAGDLGVLKALGRPTPRAAESRSGSWRPWRAYAVLHLWTALSEGDLAP